MNSGVQGTKENDKYGALASWPISLEFELLYTYCSGHFHHQTDGRNGNDGRVVLGTGRFPVRPPFVAISHELHKSLHERATLSNHCWTPDLPNSIVDIIFLSRNICFP